MEYIAQWIGLSITRTSKIASSTTPVGNGGEFWSKLHGENANTKSLNEFILVTNNPELYAMLDLIGLKRTDKDQFTRNDILNFLGWSNPKECPEGLRQLTMKEFWNDPTKAIDIKDILLIENFEYCVLPTEKLYSASWDPANKLEVNFQTKIKTLGGKKKIDPLEEIEDNKMYSKPMLQSNLYESNIKDSNKILSQSLKSNNSMLRSSLATSALRIPKQNEKQKNIKDLSSVSEEKSSMFFDISSIDKLKK